MDIKKKSLEIHKMYRGKLETHSLIKLDSKDTLSLVYSPGVAEVSRHIADDKESAFDYTLRGRTVLVVSDGSAILGLGNLGPEAALPVMEGKCVIFKEFAGVDAFPLVIDTQDVEEIIDLVKKVSPTFGGINLEDISAPRCFEIEERLRKELDIPVMHDDQWGAATVTLAALLVSLKLKGLEKDKIKIVIAGIGAAGVATTRLLFEAGFSDITFVDSKGIIHRDRTDLTKEKKELLEKSTKENKEGSLADALQNSDVFIGLSAPSTVTKTMVESMNTDPILFTLANPTPEIMPEDAIQAGAYIVATGRSDYPNQINNSLVFPGVFKAMLELRHRQFEMGLFVAIAHALCDYQIQIKDKQSIIPSMFDREVVNIVYNVTRKYYGA